MQKLEYNIRVPQKKIPRITKNLHFSTSPEDKFSTLSRNKGVNYKNIEGFKAHQQLLMILLAPFRAALRRQNQVGSLVPKQNFLDLTKNAGLTPAEKGGI